MNIEEYRDYCLSLGEDVEERLPFQKFKGGEGVRMFPLYENICICRNKV